MRASSRVGALALAALVPALALGPTSPPSAAARSPHRVVADRPAVRHTLPEAIGARAGVRQMITVSAPSFDSTLGTLRAWRRPAGGRWVLARGPVLVVVGYSGWVVAAERSQSTGTTPAGRFSVPFAFGRRPDPGARLRYRRVDGDDWWPYEPRDPATYNVYQRHRAPATHWRRDKAEQLDTYTEQYGYALVVGFNLPGRVHYSPARRQWVAARRADTSRGGGIFLHVRGDGLTAGCVAMSRPDMRWLVRWVRPGAHPQVVMGPHDYIVTL